MYHFSFNDSNFQCGLLSLLPLINARVSRSVFTALILKTHAYFMDSCMLPAPKLEKFYLFVNQVIKQNIVYHKN